MLLLLAVPASAKELIDLTPRDFTRLGSHPLGMGGAWVTEGADEQALFHNPAGLALQKLPRFGTSHSARHFPGAVERDQLDADPTALIWPVSPLLTVGHGWVTQGELGYDHADLVDPAFPKQHLWGRERVDGLAFDLLLLRVGGARREQRYRYANDTTPDALADPSLTMEGEGTAVGVIATVFPGMRYGWMQEKLDQDYMVFEPPRSYGVARTTESSGVSVHPTGWLTFAWQTDAPRYRMVVDGEKSKVPGTPVKRFGCEVKLAPFGELRMGCIDGERTWGGTLRLFRSRIHWAQADGQMPRIVQGEWPSGKYEDVHAYSWSVGL